MNGITNTYPIVSRGPNRAQRRKSAHVGKPFAAIEAKRQLSHERNTAKRASMKRNRGNQSGGITQVIAQPKRESVIDFVAQEQYGYPKLSNAA